MSNQAAKFGNVGVRVRMALTLLVLTAGVTFALNAFGSPLVDAARAPGSEHEFHGFEKVRERTQALAAQGSAIAAGAEGYSACVDGAAGQYACDGIDLLSRVSLGQMGLSFGNDVWGWTDPVNGQDYALMGGIEGTAAVRITNPLRPKVVAMLPSAVVDLENPFWRDIKVHDDHAFIVSEMVDHGMQVFDLSQLRDLDGSEMVELSAVANYGGIGSSHNIAINEESATAYVVGSVDGGDVVCGEGLHMISIAEPADPTFAGCWAAGGYVHDTQCVIYSGPDEEHTGKEICVNSIANYMMDNMAGLPVFENTLAIVDVTDKANPTVLSSELYGSGIGYSHQGWLSEDQSTFFHGDELDELFGAVSLTTTRVWDASDLDALTLVAEPDNGSTAIDHNMYTRGDVLYQSNYSSGLRLRDAGNPTELSEIAFFDTYPENDVADFVGGTWSNYAYYPREGLIAVSSIDRGLFILGRDLDVAPSFACSSNAGALTWTDAGQSLYWIYKSIDDGVSYQWIGKSSEATFNDPSPAAGDLYQVHYAGTPRTGCTIALEAPVPPPFSCSVEAGVVSWTDVGAEKYWIYRSTDGGESYEFIARRTNGTTKRDPAPSIGALYQVHYAGVPRVDCEVLSEPAASLTLDCVVSGATLNWADAAAEKYWVYRSTDGGSSYQWIGRTLGETTFVDPDPVEGASYQVHYAGIPRRNCAPASE